MIVIVDYGVGNLLSLRNAIKHSGFDARVSRDSNDIKNASKLILPGVGAFQTGITNIIKFDLENEIITHAKSGKALLGICLGYQLLTNSSDEFGIHSGLKILNAECRKLSPGGESTLPHIGWNSVYSEHMGDGFASLLTGNKFYFVHSYAVKTHDARIQPFFTSYGAEKFVSASRMDNIFGFQFHPEKSGAAGLDLLKYFLELEDL